MNQCDFCFGVRYISAVVQVTKGNAEISFHKTVVSGLMPRSFTFSVLGYWKCHQGSDENVWFSSMYLCRKVMKLVSKRKQCLASVLFLACSPFLK